jgi:hypothetical protein
MRGAGIEWVRERRKKCALRKKKQRVQASMDGKSAGPTLQTPVGSNFVVMEAEKVDRNLYCA